MSFFGGNGANPAQGRVRRRIGGAAVLGLALGQIGLTIVADAPASAARTPGEIVRYDFGDGPGSTTVSDTGSGPASDLTIGNPANVTWVPGGGLTINSPTTLSTTGAATEVLDAVTATDEVTVEAWIAAENTDQDGPARVVSMSSTATQRNFTLGQGRWGSQPSDVYDVRVRSDSTNANGEPSITTATGTATTELTHVVFTRAANGTSTIYLDGTPTLVNTTAFTGDLDDWAAMPLLLANEAGGTRPWLGTYCSVAIYDTALSAGEVGDNFDAGCVIGANADPDVTNPGDQSSSEGDSVALPIVASDGDGDEIAFSAAGLPDGLSIDPSSGLISGTISQTAANGSPYATAVTVTDDRGGESSVGFSWTVDAVNVDPVLDPIGDLVSAEGAPTGVVFTGSDVDGDDLTFTADVLPTGLTLSPDGTVSGTPTVQQSIVVTVTVDDGNGGTDSETFDWSIVGNDPPDVTNPGDQLDDEGDTISLQIVATDPDGDDVSFEASGLPDGLSIDAGSGSISGEISQTAADGSPFDVTVTVTDAPGESTPVSFSWVVNVVNLDPVLDPIGDQSNDEGDSVSLAVNANDGDSDGLTFDATGLPTGLSIDPGSGLISGTTTTAGVFAVTVTVEDDAGGVDDVSFSWTVSEVTGPQPIIEYDFTEGGGSTVGDSGPAGLDLTISNPGNVSWVPGGGLTINSSTVITSGGPATALFDAVQGTNEMTVEAWVQPANNTQEGPARLVSNSASATARNFMLGQGAWSSIPDNTFATRFRTTASVSGEPTLFTPAGTATTDLTHVVMTRNAAGSITMYVDGAVEATQTRTGTLANWDTSYPLVLSNLGNGTRPWLGTFCSVAIYDIALTAGEVDDNFDDACVIGANADPVFGTIVDQNDDEGSLISFQVPASDPDGDVLSFEASGLPDGLSIDPSSGLISGTISQTAANGSPYTVELTIDDGRGGTAVTSFNWTVDAVNVDPVLDPIGDLVSAEGAPTGVVFTGSDVDGDDLTFTADVLPTGLTLSPDGTVSGTPTVQQSIVVTVTVDDGNGGTDSETFDWSIVGNDPPDVTNPGDQLDDEGDTISLQIVATDPDGDDVSFEASGLPDGLSIDAGSGLISGEISQTAADGSPFDVTVTVTDAPGESTPVSFSWVVNVVNLDPVLDPIGDQSNDEGDSVSLAVNANDGDGDGLTFAATGLPSGLSIDPGSGLISGTTTTAGVFAVTVTVEDDAGGVDDVSFSWTVSEVTGPQPIIEYDFGDGVGTTVSDTGSGAPMDLTFGAGQATWVGGGLQIASSATITSGGPATKLFDAVTATNEMTVEAWVSPANTTQEGPARLVSSSLTPFARNFMLGQGAWSNFPDDTFAARFRTTSSVSGEPTLFTPAGSATTGLTHVVMTRAGDGSITMYIDGVEVASQTRTGTLSNWDTSFPLVLGNVGDGSRPWQGTFCEVAVYDQALTDTEVGANFDAGCDLSLPPEVLIEITPGEGIGATTFGNSSISVTSLGVPGSPNITSVSFDLRGSLVPDATFDPIGTAGDEGTQCLAVAAEGGTGFVSPGDPCVDPFSLPHEDAPGIVGNGWDGMTLQFDDFDIGETIEFGVDVDPTTIQGVAGSGGAGAVSGLELSGSTVTVTFDDQSELTSQLFGDGTAGGGQVILSPIVGQTAPTGIEMLGVTTNPTVFPNNSQAGNVAAVGPQTVRVTGPIGADVTLLAVDGALPATNAFDLDNFESDAANAVAYATATIGGTGFVDFQVNLTDENELYHYVAAIDDGATGQLSDILVIGIGDTETPVINPIANVSVFAGDTVSVDVQAVDPNGDAITLSLASTPDVEALGAVLSDAGDGSGSLTWLTELSDVGVYDIQIEASDGTFSSIEAFTITVIDPSAAVPGQALVEITPGGGIGATTFGTGSISVENVGGADAPDITSVFFDMRGSLVPDATFDPVGDAGDATAQCLALSSGAAATGYVAPTLPCINPHTIPHEDSPGVVGNGFDGMTLNFTDFNIGEAAVFGVDVDPTTIQNAPGAGGAGAVSGLELTGTWVTVEFSDGTSASTQLFGDGSAGGGSALVATDTAPVTLDIEMIGVGTFPTVFPNASRAGFVEATGTQTVRLTGAPGEDVTLLVMEGEPPAAGAFDPDPFESDEAVSVSYQADTFDGSGVADFAVNVSSATNLFHFVAASGDGSTGQLSDILVVAVGEPVDPGSVLYRVNAGGPEVAATDGGQPWEEDQATAGAGGTATTGIPSEYLVSGSDNTYGTTDTIVLSDPSVPAAAPMALFQTERYDVGDADGSPDEMVWEFAVGSGQAYTVDLYFAEIFAEDDGIREFGVEVEGQLVLDEYDIHALVGHDAGIVVTIETPVVADDYLTITFLHQTENPKVNAIEIRNAGTPPTDAPPTIVPIANLGMQEGGSLAVPIFTSEPDGDTVTLSYESSPDASGFTSFTDDGDGSGELLFQPVAGDAGIYTVTVTASDADGSDTEVFVLTVSEPPPAGAIFARVNSGGGQLAALDGGPVWQADPAFLTQAGSNGTAGFPAVDPGPTVPAYVPGAIFDTERYSTSGFAYGVPVPAGTQTYVRLFLGNGFDGTNAPGERVFDISIDGVVVEDGFDLIPAFGDLTGGMLEYLVVSDGQVDVSFSNITENPLLNGLEVVSAESAPGELGASPGMMNFGLTLIGSSKNQTLTLSNLGFAAGDPAIEITDVSVDNSEFVTDFSGPVTLPANGSTSIDVAFQPTTAGAQGGTLTITHDGDNSPVTVTLDGTGTSDIPVSFDASGLAGESSSNPTSLQFGPDDRLYVSQQNGLIYAYTIQRNGSDDYDVIATEQINLVQQDTPNHNDDGTTNSSNTRQVTGLVVTGTANAPVLYVSSSDSRISVGNDSGLDTNSGVVSRLTWNGSSWDKVDIVRGLPRSEENHSSNGMALDETNNVLYLMQGGHANKGAPGNNFSGTPEYYLSAAMLSIDLDAIEALPISTDLRDGQPFVYDLPTLMDGSRGDIGPGDPGYPYAPDEGRYPEVIDVGDPFGGNNSRNQAIPEPGGPVQIYSPGYRNAYDVVLTQNGRLYTSDNGPNGGWGGLPLIYDSGGTLKGHQSDGSTVYNPGAGDYCTNEFNDDGSAGHGDPLYFVDGPGFYGGHPTPIRAFPGLADVIVYENSGGWIETFRDSFENLLPAGLTLADFPNDPDQCDYQADDSSIWIDIINASTNGITEYTASNFGGALQGNILTASFDGNVYRYAMNAAGDAFVEKEALFGGFGSQPLDVTVQSDDDVFPGTVWAAVYGANTIQVFEPLDFNVQPCTGDDDPALDDDDDGFSNADEIDNGTNPCSAGSSPDDNDGDFVSDLNDTDDDNDGIDDEVDEFALDADNGLSTTLPVFNPLENNDPGTFLFGLGLSGLMTNGVDNWLDQFDPDNLAAGGNGGELGIENITAGDAYLTGNDQFAAFQYGVDADTSTAPFIVETEILAPIFGDEDPVNFMSMGLQVGAGTQDEYLKVVVNANSGNGGVQVLLESGAPPSVLVDDQYGVAEIGGDVLSATAGVVLSVEIDPSTLMAQPRVQIDGGSVVDLGAPISIPAAWLDPADENGLAVGSISTSTGGTPFDALWEYLNVRYVDGTGEPTDALYRVNAGGPEIPASDGGIPWEEDQTVSAPGGSAVAGTPSEYVNWDVPVSSIFADTTYAVAASTVIDLTGVAGTGAEIEALFETERYREPSGTEPPMTWTFPVPNGDYEVVLYGAEIWDGEVGSARVMDVTVEGVPAVDDLRWSIDGTNINDATEIVIPTTVTDGAIVVELVAVTQNPKLSAIEIRAVGPPPAEQPPIVQAIADQSVETGSSVDIGVMATEPDDDAITLTVDGPAFVTLDDAGDGTGTLTIAPQPGDEGIYTVTVNASDDGQGPGTGASFDLTVTAPSVDAAEYRINVGGPQVAAADATTPEWSEDTGANPSPYRTAGSNGLFSTADGAAYTPIVMGDASIPPSAPSTVFDTERWDDVALPEMTWAFPVDAGATYEVRLLFAEIYFNGGNGIVGAGERVFDVTLEGAVPPEFDNIDPFGDAGAAVAFARSAQVTMTDDILELVFVHVTENPALKGIEIIEIAPPAGNLAPSFDQDLGDQNSQEGDVVTLGAGATDPDAGPSPLVYADGGTLPPGLSIDATTGEITGTIDVGAASGSPYAVELTVTDGQLSDTDTFTWNVTEPVANVALPLRVNVGGDEVAAADASLPAWSADTDVSPSPYRIAGGENTFAASSGSAHPGEIDMTDPSLPASVPIDVFEIERWDPLEAPEMLWQFPVADGTDVEVRLFFAELYNGVTTTGQRVFDVAVEGAVPVAFDDIDQFAVAGAKGAFMLSTTVTVSGSTLDIELLHDVIENPALKGIEIIEAAPVANVAPVFNVPLDDGTDSENSPYSQQVAASDADGDPIAYSLIGAPSGMTIDTAGLIEWTPDYAGSGVYAITVKLDDGVNPPVSDTFELSIGQTEPPGAPIYRVNAGGPQVAAQDGSFPDWSADTAASPSPYYVGGGNGIFSTGDAPDLSHPTVPPTASAAVYQTERYGNMVYAFPVDAGTEVEVRILLNETFQTQAGVRSFDIAIDGETLETAVDPFAIAGHDVAFVLDYVVESDGIVDIVITTQPDGDNGSVKGIEILGVSGVPGIGLLGDLNGSTITTDTLTVEWMFNGYNDADIDHAHFMLDGGPVTDPPAYAPVSGDHNTIYRPFTSIPLEGLTDGEHTVTVQVADASHTAYPNPGATATATFTVDTGATEEVLFRVNVGGAEVAAADGSLPVWTADNAASPSPYRNAGGANIFAASDGGAHPGGIVMTHPSLPASVPVTVFETERWDPTDEPEMLWQIPVTTGTDVEVRLFFAELYGGVDAAGERVFDVAVEGTVPVAFDNIDQFAIAGAKGAFMLSTTVTVDGPTLDIELLHDVIENTALKGIEIIEAPAPPNVLFRVNAGGPTVAATDGGPAWSSDLDGAESSYLTAAYLAGAKATSSIGATNAVDGTVPTSTPAAVFASERWDPLADSEMSWLFPVVSGTNVEVRLYFADYNLPTQTVGARTFDVAIEGATVLTAFDIFATASADTGTMQSFAATADADGINIDFNRVVENPEIRAIEIIEVP